MNITEMSMNADTRPHRQLCDLNVEHDGVAGHHRFRLGRHAIQRY